MASDLQGKLRPLEEVLEILPKNFGVENVVKYGQILMYYLWTKCKWNFKKWMKIETGQIWSNTGGLSLNEWNKMNESWNKSNFAVIQVD